MKLKDDYEKDLISQPLTARIEKQDQPKEELKEIPEVKDKVETEQMSPEVASVQNETEQVQEDTVKVQSSPELPKVEATVKVPSSSELPQVE